MYINKYYISSSEINAGFIPFMNSVPFTKDHCITSTVNISPHKKLQLENNVHNEEPCLKKAHQN